MLHNATDLGPKAAENGLNEYHCEKCDYTTSHLSHWKRHLKTKKHNATKMLHNATDLGPKKYKKELIDENGCFCCDCGKTYKHHSSFYRHKSKCNWKPPIEETLVEVKKEEEDAKPYVTFGSKEALDHYVKLVSSNAGNNNTNINGNNNMNTNFNINLYLNEQCANALSIQDFAQKLRITMADLSSMKANEPRAITNIIKKNLDGLADTERPMHNHDQKWYVKDKAEGWENEGGDKIVCNIKSSIAKKSGPVFVESNPNWAEDSRQGQQYAEVINVTMGEISGNNLNKVLDGIQPECFIGPRQA